MSARIRVILPILNRECLIEALEQMGYTVQIDRQLIVLPQLSHYYKAYFEKNEVGKYVFSGDADFVERNFTQKLRETYFQIYRAREARNQAEIERLRREQQEIREKQERQEKIERCRRLEEKAREDLQRAQAEALAFERQQEEHRKAEESRIAEERRKAEEEVKRLEEELTRMQEEKRKFIEAQTQAIKEKAQKMGYTVKMEKKDNKVQLVMVKREY